MQQLVRVVRLSRLSAGQALRISGALSWFHYTRDLRRFVVRIVDRWETFRMVSAIITADTSVFLLRLVT
jgi:hypothetical protein